MRILYKFKRVLTIFVLCCMLCTVFFSSHSYLVFASSSNDAFHNAIDPTLWGEGLSWDECSAEQKEYRAKQLAGMYVNDIARAACSVLGGVAGENLYDLVFNSTVKGRAIAQGYTTETEYLMRNAGLGYLFDTEDPSNLPAHFDNLTFSADLLNTLQQVINETKENETGVVTAYCATPTMMGIYTGDTATDIISRAQYISMYVKDLVKTHGFCFMLRDVNYIEVFYCDGGINDYYLYGCNGNLVNYNGSNEKSDIVGLRSKSGESFHLYRKKFGDIGYGYWSSASVEYRTDYNVEDIWSGTDFAGRRTPQNAYLNGVKNCPLAGNDFGSYYHSHAYFITSYDHFQMYKSSGWVDTTKDFGAVIPSIIQATNAIKEWTESQTVTGNDIINYYNTYDYSRIINEIGDTSNFDQQELQDKIDEIIGGLQESIEHGNDISEESNSWLSKIYDKLKDIEDKIGSGGGGVISDIADFVHWSELQLKLDAIIANLTSIRKDVDEISDNQSDMDALLNKLDQESQGLANKAKSKFPFCIPWDMLILYKSLEAMPQVPTFNWTLTIPSWGIEEEFTIELSKFEIVAKISRYFFDIIFFMALCKLGLSMSGYSFSIEKT